MLRAPALRLSRVAPLRLRRAVRCGVRAGGGYNAPTNRRGGGSTSQYGCEYASQQFVYQGLGRGVLNNALNGFNCCLFAYGQTGSGKSYSFVGYGTNKGIVPQVCDEIFKRKTDIEASGTTQMQVISSCDPCVPLKRRRSCGPRGALGAISSATRVACIEIRSSCGV